MTWCPLIRCHPPLWGPKRAWRPVTDLANFPLESRKRSPTRRSNAKCPSVNFIQLCLFLWFCFFGCVRGVQPLVATMRKENRKEANHWGWRKVCVTLSPTSKPVDPAANNEKAQPDFEPSLANKVNKHTAYLQFPSDRWC